MKHKTLEEALNAFTDDLIKIVQELNEKQKSYNKMIDLLPEVKL